MNTFNVITPESALMAMMLKFHAHGRDSYIYHALQTPQDQYILQWQPIHSQITVISHKHHIQLDLKQTSTLMFSLLASTPL